MKKLFFVLMFSFFVAAQVYAACPDTFPLPEIEIYSAYGKLNYITDKNNQEITAIAGKNGTMEKGIFASGLSTTEIKMDINLKTIGENIGEYDICVYPTAAKISIFFSNPTIYISNDLIPYSCEYKIVLRHEQTHQQINKSALEYFLPLFKSAAEKIFSSMKPLNVKNISDIDDASAQITEEYNKKMTPLYEFFKQQLLAEQQKLDDQINYDHENNLCR